MRAYGRAMLHPVIPVVWLAVSVFGIVAGPFGTEMFSLTGRLAFWPITIGASVLIGGLLRVIVQDYLHLRTFWPEAPLIAVLATLVLPPPLMLLAKAVAGHEQHVPSFAAIVSYVFIMSMITSTLRHAVALTWPLAGMPETPARAAEAPAAVAEPAARLMARLSPQLRAPLVRLQMRDHYVEVFTEAGSETVLLRMADAICAAEGVEGLQVHRSHWVARQAMRGVTRGQGRVTLVLRDGTMVPVSRGNAPTILALGLAEVLPSAENSAQAPRAVVGR